mmetsp:Transcript_56940/g.162216  ORF Transcript_56940/g.162216 Transcript_56940/m.162216 type:complete len:347 (+) Transcript_56940:110-1150(+)
MSAPPQPQPPELEVLDSTKIKIKWEAVSCKPAPTNYAVAMTSSTGGDDTKSTWYIDRSGNAHADKKNANVFGANCRSITVVDLAMGPTYRAQIAVKIGEKWSAYSELSESCVISNPEPPAAPMITVINEKSIRVSWLLDDLGCYPKASHVAIALKDDGPGVRYVDKRGELHTDKVPVIDKGAKEVIVTGLRENVPYKVQMAVQSDVGWSKYSPFCPPDKIAKPIQLDPPVLEVVHGDRIQVIWEPPKLGLPCTAYAVALNDGKVTLYLDAKGAPHDNKDNASIIPATQTSIMVPLLLENVAYKAQVASRNMLGWGPYSNFSQTQTVVKELKKMSPVVQEDDFEIAM